jgi:hypothetical protein
MSKGWKTLRHHSSTLIDSRLQLHWAAQVLASVGGQHVEPESDDSHRNMEWVDEFSSFVGNQATGEPDFRMALHPTSLELRLLDAKHAQVSSFDLNAHTLDEAYRWAGEAVSSFTGKDPVGLTRPEYELPPHAVAQGAKFDIPTEDLNDLRDWFADSDLVLRTLAEKLDSRPSIRCWPHHFDIGGFLPLTAGDDPEKQRSVGFGMTPGDGSYPEPYWYVSPWPYPGPDDLPGLPAGHWHTDGWTGAILTATEIEKLESAEDQKSFVSNFVENAMESARKVALTRLI